MDDISEKIKEILNDEESMQQIRELADMLTGGSSSADSGEAECFDPEPPQGNVSQENRAPDMNGLLSMLSGMTGGSAGGIPDGIDMNMIMQLSEILRSTSKEDNNRAFLLALRPLLGEDKQKKIDKAVKLLRLYAVFTAMKKNGMLNRLEDII